MDTRRGFGSGQEKQPALCTPTPGRIATGLTFIDMAFRHIPIYSRFTYAVFSSHALITRNGTS
jgi:hypothetical protein